MKKFIILIITYIFIFFNSILLSNEKKNLLNVGLLAPLSGEYKELGESMLYSLQLALNEIKRFSTIKFFRFNPSIFKISDERKTLGTDIDSFFRLI